MSSIKMHSLNLIRPVSFVGSVIDVRSDAYWMPL